MMIARHFVEGVAQRGIFFGSIVDLAPYRTLQDRCVDEGGVWMGVRFVPMSQVPPITTIFIPYLSICRPQAGASVSGYKNFKGPFLREEEYEMGLCVVVRESSVQDRGFFGTFIGPRRYISECFGVPSERGPTETVGSGARIGSGIGGGSGQLDSIEGPGGLRHSPGPRAGLTPYRAMCSRWTRLSSPRSRRLRSLSPSEATGNPGQESGLSAAERPCRLHPS